MADTFSAARAHGRQPSSSCSIPTNATSPCSIAVGDGVLGDADLVVLTGQPEDVVAGLLTLLEHTGLVRRDAHAVPAPAHDLVRHAILDTLDPSERRELHRRIARHLDARWRLPVRSSPPTSRLPVTPRSAGAGCARARCVPRGRSHSARSRPRSRTCAAPSDWCNCSTPLPDAGRRMVGGAPKSGPLELAIFDFRVLGPLEVRRNGELLSLQGLRQRTVLAVLLIETGHVVSNDRLAELVWDGAPPGDAHGTIQVYVSKLRRTLAPRDDPHAADPVLVTQSPGYMIDASTEDIDAARFTRHQR